MVEHRYLNLPSNNEEHTTDSQTRQQHIHPDIWGERVEKREDSRVGAIGFTVQNTNPQGHKWLGEVYYFLSDISDGQRCHSQISYLKRKCTDSQSFRVKQIHEYK